MQNLFHQEKGSRSISLNSHYLVVFKNPRDKLQVLPRAKQMYPRHTDFFINHYEQAVQRHFGYLLVDLKTTTQDNCRLRTNVLPGEERFDNVAVPDDISQEVLQYLKQQNVMTPPVVPVIKKLQDSVDGLLSRSDLGDDERAKHYMQLQNKYLTFKQQLNSRLKDSNPPYCEEQRQISSNLMPAESRTSDCTGSRCPNAHGYTGDRCLRTNSNTNDARGSVTSLVHLKTPSHSTLTYTEKKKTTSSSV